MQVFVFSVMWSFFYFFIFMFFLFYFILFLEFVNEYMMSFRIILKDASTPFIVNLEICNFCASGAPRGLSEILYTDVCRPKPSTDFSLYFLSDVFQYYDSYKNNNKNEVIKSKPQRMLLKIGENIERPQVFSLNISFLIKISLLCLYLLKFTWILIRIYSHLIEFFCF